MIRLSFVLFSLLITSLNSFAQFSVIIGSDVPASAVTITDNGRGDGNRVLNAITYNGVVPLGRGWGSSGTVTQSIAAASAIVTLTNCTIGHTGAPGVQTGTISFESDPFAAIGPPAELRGHLNGSYIKVNRNGPVAAGNPLDQADVMLDARVKGAGAFGNVDPVCRGAGCAVPRAVNANFNFGPPGDPDAVAAAVAATTSLQGDLKFSLGPNPGGAQGIVDGIQLPQSAFVSVTIPPKPKPPKVDPAAIDRRWFLVVLVLILIVVVFRIRS